MDTVPEQIIAPHSHRGAPEIGGRTSAPVHRAARATRPIRARRTAIEGRTGRGDALRRRFIWLRWLMLFTLLVPVLAAVPAIAGVAAQAADEENLMGAGTVVGRHYRQTGSGTGLGYDVREPYFSRMLALGGPTSVGYPASVPFRSNDGCTYQGFQVMLLQSCPGFPVRLANTFQLLEEAGSDARLQELGIGTGEPDGSSSFEEAVGIRLSWLEDAAIRERFLSQCGDGDPAEAIQFCGLPMNRPQRFGPFISQRFQRIAFQRWLADGPGGIRTGDISTSLGGDLLKETGVLSGPAVQPHRVGQLVGTPIVTFVARPGMVALQPPAPRPATAGVTGGRRTQALAYGFQAHFFDTSKRPQTIALIKNAGFGWAKQQVPWTDYEISAADCARFRANCTEQSINGRPKYFSKDQVEFLDAVVNDLSGAGLSVLLSVVRSPSFYAAPGGHAPADPDQLRDFVQFLAIRYQGKVKAIEPWNEQNLSWEWGGSRLWPNAPAGPPQGVVDFVRLQKAAYQGVKAGDPSIAVVLPALTPTGLGECWLSTEARAQGFCLEQVKTAIDDRLYLDFMYQVNDAEIRNYYDVLGVHPSGYNNPPDDFSDRKTVSTTSFKEHGSFYIKRYQQLREVQLKYGDSKPMWFTEVGWSSTRGSVPGYEYGRDNTEEARGKYVARMLEQVENDAPYVTNIILWNLNFRTLVPESDEKFGFGMVNPDGSPTPAYTCAGDFVRNRNRTTRPECKS